MRALTVLCVIAAATSAANGEDLDFSHQSLKFADWRGRDLRNANFDGTDLTMAKFAGADLRGANLSAAKLDRINLDDADLRGVIGWSKADLGLGISANGANFSGTDLRQGKLAGGYSGGYFEKANFTNADLRDATLAGRFHNAVFDGADVAGALMLGAGGIEPLKESLSRRGAIVTKDDFAQAIKLGRDFSDAILRGVQLQAADLRKVRLARADLHSACLDEARLEESDLSHVEFYWGTANRARFTGSDLSDSIFNNVQARGARFDGCRMTRASLSNAQLSDASFRNCILTGVDLSFADLTGSDLTDANLDGAILEGAIISHVRGLEPAAQKSLKEQAGRWKYDLRLQLSAFLGKWSLPLHLLLTPITATLGAVGYRAQRRRTFLWLASINLLSLVPLLTAVMLSLLGGSPTRQLSEPRLWSAWIGLWLLMMPGMAVLLLISLVVAGIHLVWSITRKPRTKLALSLSCALLSPVNCLFALCLLGTMAPDA